MAWLMTAMSLVFIMIPGVGYFYSGLLRRKNALSKLWTSMLSIAVVSLQARLFVMRTECPHSAFCSGFSGDIL